MIDDDFSIKKKKKKKKSLARRPTNLALMTSIGGGVVFAGLVCVGLGVGLKRRSNSVEPALLILGVLLIFVGGALCLIPHIALGGFGPKKLLFLEDRIEVRAGKTVLGQIPFSNVASAMLTYVDYKGGSQGVAIMLYKPRDPDTWWPHGIRDREYDLVIVDQFDVPMTAILREVLEGTERYLERKTGRVRDPGI